MISENITLPYKKNVNIDKETNKDKNISDCARINSYVSNELLIIKSEMKIEKSDNTNLIENEKDFVLSDRCYILHDPLVKKMTSIDRIKLESIENTKENKNLVLTNVESLNKISSDKMKSADYLSIINTGNGNNDEKNRSIEFNNGINKIVKRENKIRFESNNQLEIIDLNDEICGNELSIENFDLNVENMKENEGNICIIDIGDVCKEKQTDLLENVEESVRKFVNEFENIPVSTSLSDSCKMKGKRKRVFVLKRHRRIVENNNIDFSQIKLKDLINIEPFLPAPKSRLNHKLLKDYIKLKSKSQIFHRKNEFNKRITEKFRIDLNGDIVMNEENDNTVFPTIGNMEEIVMNSDDIKSSSRSFKARKLSGKRWNEEEKENFYKALMVTGTDFTLMATIFPKRSRDDLKKKFKVEEKLNPKLIEQILRSRVKCDSSLLKLDSHLVSKNIKNRNKKPF